MFYPKVFASGTTLLPPAKVLEIEASVMATLVQSDRAYVSGLANQALVLILLEELLNLGMVTDAEREGALDLLAANANGLHHFVRNELQRPPLPADWDWVVPDYGAIREALGPAAEAEWRGRVVRLQERALGPRVAATNAG